MSENMGVEPDPSVVFTPEYWGRINPPANRLALPEFSTRHRQRVIARYQLAQLIPGIVSGEIEGQVLRGGRFNSTDPDLVRASVHNMPGTVLLVDGEVLTPLDYYNEKWRKPVWPDGRGDPADFSSSTRHLLRKERVSFDDYTTDYGKGRVVYASDRHEYSRTVDIVYLVPNTQNTATPYSGLTVLCKLPNPGSRLRPVVGFFRATSLYSDVQIGESYDSPIIRPDYNGNRLERIVSLEVCMQGEPVQAHEPALSRMLGRLAGNHGH